MQSPKAGLREFYVPGKVDGMPKNTPGTLICKAKGHKPIQKQINAEDRNQVASLSGDPLAIRYFSEITATMGALDNNPR